MSHATCTYGSQVDSRHFVVGSQIASLTPDLSFCHNLCCVCPNGSCETILDICTWITFQWYINARCFDLYNHSLKFWEFIGTPTPKMGVHLGVWVFILTLFHTPLGLRPKLGSRQTITFELVPISGGECHNPNLGLVTKARDYKGVGQKWSLRV